MNRLPPISGPARSRHLAHLEAVLREACLALHRHLGMPELAETAPVPAGPPSLTPGETASLTGLEALSTSFALTPFEILVLVLALGPDISAAAAQLCAAANGDAQQPFLTPALALAALPDASLGAFAALGTLRFWHLVELDTPRPGATLQARIVVPEAVRQFLVGQPHLDEALATLVDPLDAAELLPGEQALADRMASALAQDEPPILYLAAAPSRRALDVAAGAARILGARLYHLPGDRVPPDAEASRIARLWQRDQLWIPGVLALSVARAEGDNRDVEARMLALLSRLTAEPSGPIIVIGDGLDIGDRFRRPAVRFGLAAPTADETRARWRRLLGLDPTRADAAADHLALRFRLPATTTDALAAIARREAEAASGQAPAAADAVLQHLLPLLREQCRHGLARLATHVEGGATVDDLVLPQSARAVLEQIVRHYRNSARVLDGWGFGRGSGRGRGLSVLLTGPSGTGKTMAAEAVANALGLDLFRIDLSQMVDKYVGETEKNLARLFDAAEASDVVLLFDEADALFGRRGEARDSHDHHVNREIGYLLQRIESFRGIAVLTSNLPASIDPAFSRRLSYVVHFPFPDAALRREIWRRAIPAQAPTRGLDLDRLARLSLSGGQIRTLSLNAAMLAADREELLSMGHIADAVRAESAAAQRPAPVAELEGWPQ